MAKKEQKGKEEKEKPLTPKQVARKTLESKLFQNIVGSNKVRTNQFLYGQLGVNGAESTYDGSMTSDEVTKIRNEIYQGRKKEGEGLDVYGEPSYPTNYDVSVKISREVENSKRLFSLGELEKIIKSLTTGLEKAGFETEFDFAVPDELKKYVPQELYEKMVMAEMAKKTGKEAKSLSEKEKDAIQIYQEILSKAYDRGIALKTTLPGYFADINALGKQFSEKYKKPEKEKKK